MARLRSTGLDLDGPLLPAYSAERLTAWVEIAAEAEDLGPNSIRLRFIKDVVGVPD